MTYVPNCVRPNHLTIHMVGRRGVSGNGRGQEEQDQEGGHGEQQRQEDRHGEDARGQDEDKEDVAGLFGDPSEEEAEQPPRRVRQRRGDAHEANADEEDRQESREEVPPPPNVHLPISPGREEWDEHFRTHIHFRSWCPVCVEARGRENPHYRRKERVRPGLPTICMDYTEIRKGRPPIIVIKDQAAKSMFCHQSLRKGATGQWIVKRILRDVENTGHVAITLKGDGEPAMQDLLRAIQEQRTQPANIEHSPGNDPQSNGVAEKTVQDAMGQIRTMRNSD